VRHYEGRRSITEQIWRDLWWTKWHGRGLCAIASVFPSGPFHQCSTLVSVHVEASWNVMAHVQKPDFVFRWNGRVHLNRQGRQVSRLLAVEVCASAFIVGSNAGYTLFRGSEKGTGYPLHSPVSPSLPLSCVTVCHHISTGVYHRRHTLLLIKAVADSR